MGPGRTGLVAAPAAWGLGLLLLDGLSCVWDILEVLHCLLADSCSGQASTCRACLRSYANIETCLTTASTLILWKIV